MFEYVPFEESLYRAAERHINRGVLHLATGNLDYAAGSFKKAERKLAAAEQYSSIFSMEGS